MLKELVRLYRKGYKFGDLEALAARLIAENDRLRLENALLRKENRYLRRQLRDRELRLLRRAQADAVLLGVLWYSGAPTSRRECEAIGMSRRRWQWARALLRCGGVLGRDSIDVSEFSDFERLLSAGVSRVEEDGIRSLSLLLPRHGRSAPRAAPRPAAPRPALPPRSRSSREAGTF